MTSLLIIDVSSFIFRAYYAIPKMHDQNGKNVNAIYGFVNSFLQLSEKFKNYEIIATLDSKETTKRKEKYEDYKANRKEVDPELKEQFPEIKPMLEALNLPYIEKEGYEADDIIASIVKKYPNKKIVIVSSDKDLMQLINDNVSMYDSMTKKFIKENEVVEKFLGVKPSQIRDLLALMGDRSDNIPGIPGIGVKTAAKLLNKYQNIEGILENLDKLPKKQKEKFEQNLDKLEKSKELATLVYDLEIDNSKIKKWQGFEEEKFKTFAEEKKFKSILKRVGISSNKLEKKSTIQLKQGELFLSKEKECFLLNLKNKLYLSQNGKFLETTFEKLPKNIKIYSFKIKEFIPSKILDEIEIIDLQMAYFITNSGQHSYELKDIANKLSLFFEKNNIENNLKILMEIQKQLKLTPKQKDLLDKIEIPTIKLLKKMEEKGITINQERLIGLKNEFLEAIDKIEREIYAQTGQQFNINSPKQLAKVLFETLNLPSPTKKHSTKHEVLEKLAQLGISEIPELVIQYREYAKLLSTYIEPIINKTDEQNKLHTTYEATYAATGRLSSRNPNLQNIPVRTETGRKIRSIFTASKNHQLISLDYSQIELRILAHLSKDKELLEAFENNMDIHKKTASAIFGVFPELVDDTMRQHAKAVNFGIIYGMQAFKLSQETGVQFKFAKEYIKNYLSFYKGVKDFIELTKSEATKNGYVETMFGRRRYIPELRQKNKTIISSGERIAVNTIIQGSAADIIKIGAINIQKEIEKSKIKANIILQIHDELIIECSKEENVEKTAELFAQIMKNTAQKQLTVPLEVHKSIAETWDKLK